MTLNYIGQSLFIKKEQKLVVFNRPKILSVTTTKHAHLSLFESILLYNVYMF